MGISPIQTDRRKRSWKRLALTAFIVASVIGWLVFGATAWIFKDSISRKIAVRLHPVPERERWEPVMRKVKLDLETNPWLDQRQPVILLGDSQMEYGDWYPAFRGSFATRNLGVAMSDINGANFIAQSLRPQHASAVVVMTGINDLASGRDVAACAKDFSTLLDTLDRNLGGKPVIVLGIMPVSRSLGELSAAEVNSGVAATNTLLKELAELHNFRFLDLAPHIGNERGLDPRFTFDGLHLNELGYREITIPLLQVLKEKAQ